MQKQRLNYKKRAILNALRIDWAGQEITGSEYKRLINEIEQADNVVGIVGTSWGSIEVHELNGQFYVFNHEDSGPEKLYKYPSIDQIEEDFNGRFEVW